MSDQYSLEELAKRVGIQPRTIRSYINQGLLRGPDSLGRNARYSEYHRKRLMVIKRLKDELRLPLSEIRRLINMAGPDEDIHLQAIPHPGQDDPGAEEKIEIHSSPLDYPESAAEADGGEDQDDDEAMSALDYVRQRKAMATGGVPSFLARRPQPSGDGPIEELLEQLRDLLGQSTVVRKTRGEEWVHLEVTPDIQIQVRGHLSPEQLAGFEELADMMRHILLGRSAQ